MVMIGVKSYIVVVKVSHVLMGWGIVNFRRIGNLISGYV